jgi:hypothetical protein
MNASFHHGSAKIYQFPVGGRARLAARQDSKIAVDTNSQSVSEVACGGCWYHQAAIEDAKLTGEH